MLHRDEDLAWLSLRNAAAVQAIAVGQLNAYDVLVSDAVVFTSAALEAYVSGTGEGQVRARPSAPAPRSPSPRTPSREDAEDRLEAGPRNEELPSAEAQGTSNEDAQGQRRRTKCSRRTDAALQQRSGDCRPQLS